jgi:PAS domain S-box-containing protein
MIQVLLVDDEAVLSELAKEWLESYGDIEVTTVASAAECLLRLRNGRFDVVVSDYQMPGMDGIELLKTLRAEGNTLPFILFTGRGRESVVIEALNSGADGYLQKGGETAPQFAELAHKVRMNVERRHSEVALRASEKRYRSLFENMREGLAHCMVVSWAKDVPVDVIVMTANLAFEGMFGAADVSGRKLGVICPWFFEANPGFLAACGRVVSTGRTESLELKVEPNRWLLASLNPSGEDSFEAIFMDVTEHKEHENELRKRDERHFSMLDHAGIGIGYWDLDGRLIMFNAKAAENMNGTPSDFVGRTVNELFGDELAGVYMGRIGKAARSDGAEEYEDMVRLPIGELWFISVYRRVLDAGGKVTGVQVVSINITERKRMELEMRSERDLFSALINSVEDEIWLSDSEGNFTMVNPKGRSEFALANVYGRVSLKDIAENLEVMRPDGTPRPLEESPPLRALRGELVRNQEEVVRTPSSGELRHRLVNSTAIRDEAGAMVGVVSVVRDITEIRRMERSLQESEERFSKAFHASSVAMSIARFSDVDGKVGRWIDVNAAFERLTGYSREETIGRTSVELGIVALHPQRSAVIDDLRADGASIGRKVDIVTKSGEVRKVLIHATTMAIRESTYVVAWSIDVTAEECYEDGKRSKALLEKIMNTTPTLIYIYDMANHCNVYANREVTDFLGYTPQEVKGMGASLFSIILHPDDAPKVAEHHARLRDASDEEVLEITYRMRNSNGDWRWLRSRDTVFLRDKQGAGTQILGSTEDITEFLRIEHELQQAHRRLGLLTGITRHDVLNQAMVIEGNADLLSDTGLQPEQMELVGKIERSAESIQRQMEFTREYQEIGAQTPAWQSLRKVVLSAQGQLGTGGMEVRTEGRDYEIRADPMFEKVVYNIIDNCLRHSGGARRLIVSGREVDGTLRVTFEDDGKGIAMERRGRVFEHSGENAGFGLFLAREILAISGITIDETSEPGMGARFELTVPAGSWRPTEVK